MSSTRHAVRLAALRLAGRPLSAIGRLRGSAARPSSHAGPHRTLRILLIRPDHLGDVLLATPAAALLRAALPTAKIDWLVGPWSSEIARLAGGPGDVLTLDFPGFTRQPKRSAVEPYALLVREAVRLRTRKYDAALILRPDHWWGAMLAAAAGIPRRFGFSIPECQPFLTDTLPPPTGHTVRANQELADLAARRLGGSVEARHGTLEPTFPVAKEDAAWAANHPLVANGSSAPLVAIHPGTGASLKGWLPERWADVTQGLTTEHGARVVLTGGPGEQALIDQITERLDPPPLALVGATTIGQLAALFAHCHLVVGGDSGPLHLAAAVGTPTVRLYGPIDVQEFGPWPPEGGHVALAAGLACQPCRNLVAPPCGARQTPPCMRALVADTVLAAATPLLTTRHVPPAAMTARSKQR